MSMDRPFDPLADPLQSTDRPQFGRYILQQKIGSGGAAVVYRAYDQVIGRTVALKVLASTEDTASLQRFQREAATAGRLRHPHIVRTLQVGLGKGGAAAYIAMSMIEGESLAQLLSRVSRLSPADSCRLLAPIANALDFAHAQGIVHRDVKPSNILLQPVYTRPQRAQSFVNSPELEQLSATGPSSSTAHTIRLDVLDLPVRPLLSDFGIARALDAPELTHIGRTVGTPAFMSPEQCAGSREVDGRADLYALGAVLFRCMLGHPPYRGSTHQVLHAHVYSPLTLDERTLAGMSPALVMLFQRSLAKDPADRFATAGAMAAHMEAIARGARHFPPTRARSSSPIDATQTLELAPVEEQATPQAILVAAPADQSLLAQSTQPSQTEASSSRRVSRPDLRLAGAAAILLLLILSVGGLQWLAPRVTSLALQGDRIPTATTQRTLQPEEEPAQLPAPLPSDRGNAADEEDSAPALNSVTPAPEQELSPTPSSSPGNQTDTVAAAPASQAAPSASEQSEPPAGATLPPHTPPATDSPQSESNSEVEPAPVPQEAPTQIPTPAAPPTTVADHTPTAEPAMVEPTPEEVQEQAAAENAWESTTENAPEAVTQDATQDGTQDVTEVGNEPEPEPELQDEENQLEVACPTTVDEFFINHAANNTITPLPADFVCPESPAQTVSGWIQQFEHGIVFYMPDTPLTYIIYAHTGTWEQFVDGPPNENASIVAVFRTLTSAPHRQAALGARIDQHPRPHDLILQRFPVGMLLGDPAAGNQYALHRDNLQP